MNYKKHPEFFESVLDGFFKEQSIDKAGLADFIGKAFIAFGTVEVEEEKNESGTRLTYIDRDEADVVVGADPNEMNEEELDMSSVMCVIYIDTNGIIDTIENGFKLFTPANKESVLMASFLIGKKVEDCVQA